MITYGVRVACAQCGETHTLPILVRREQGPKKKSSFAVVYSDGTQPPAAVRRAIAVFQCPKTTKRCNQVDLAKMFLTPIAIRKRYAI